MLFNSIDFVLFFPLVVAAYFALNPKYRWMLLLAASYYFYMCWKAEYIILIVASTVIDYFAAKWMHQTDNKRRKKGFLLLSLLSNLGILFSFKYFNFFNESARAVFDSFNIFYDVPAFDVLLPVGISFYTFQTLSYTIDVYRGDTKPETHFGRFALYVSFFPQLVAGPIERSNRLLPQFWKSYDFDYTRVKNGLILMLWGFFKKLVIADRLAAYVNPIYNNPTEHDGVSSLIATYFFSFQIYCDFSGYSDIAIGAAMVLGYQLMTNFRRPYFAINIRDFWARWHISLSTWFRDYLYIPLGGNRVVKWRWYYNLFMVFLISGLWHGANWTFVMWGALHGTYLVIGEMTKNIRAKIEQLLQIGRVKWLSYFINVFITFHMAVFAWIFFRANNIQDAFYIIKNIFTINIANFILTAKHFVMSLGGLNVANSEVFNYAAQFDLRIALFALLIMELVHAMKEKTGKSLYGYLDTKPMLVRWGFYHLLMILIIFFGVYGKQEFIYFQF